MGLRREVAGCQQWEQALDAEEVTVEYQFMKSQKRPYVHYSSSKPLLAVSFGMVIVLTMMFLFPGAPVGAVDCNDYTISFLGSAFDGTNTTFSYEVSVCALPKIKDWILGLPDSVDIAGAGPEVWEIKDEAGLSGVKFKTEIVWVEGGPCIYVVFYVTLIGNWSTGVAQAAIHPDHKDWCQKTTQGPVCPVLTMAVSPAGAGTTSPAVGTHTYGYGDAVPIEASPSTGWKFDRWEGDVTGSTNPDSVTMNGDKSVTAVFDHPVDAVDDTYGTAEDTLRSVPLPGVMANDSALDGGESVTLVSGVSHGTLSLDPNGSFTYLPDSNFSGSDSFVYELSDGDGDSDTATVTITVGPVNDAPVANDDSDTTPEDTPVTTNVVANDTDVDGTVVASTVTIVNGPSNGSTLNNGNGTVTYTPNGNFNGSDTYTYTVQDNDGATSNVATVTINV
ncbi:tandem-95 repeat protein, partial [Candidatus Bipolaricaulota bacterium]|nr:tandem-95 repeat protein [Candidatus Bipolaricaulota bacterium]